MSGVGDSKNAKDAEPDPSAIAAMSADQQVLLLKERSEREGVPKWTFCQSSFWPPRGNEFHWDPSGFMRIVSRNLGCPPLPECDKEKTGYHMYHEYHQISPDAPILGKGEWNQMQEKCFKCINTMIRKHHGILFSVRDEILHLDHNVPVTLFHVCDYITMLELNTSIIADSKLHLKPKYKPSDVNAPVVDIPEDIKKFISANADYFFLCYGIWGNHSELPILLKPPAETMPKSFDVVNIQDFVPFQAGKQQFLCFRFEKVHTNSLYFRNVPRM